MSEDRRRAERRAAHLGTEIEFADGKKAEGISIDASDAGVLVLTRATPAVGAKLHLRILRLDANDPPYDVEGEVVRVETIDPYGSIWRTRLAVALAKTPDGLHEEIERANERHRQLYGGDDKAEK